MCSKTHPSLSQRHLTTLFIVAEIHTLRQLSYECLLADETIQIAVYFCSRRRLRTTVIEANQIYQYPLFTWCRSNKIRDT